MERFVDELLPRDMLTEKIRDQMKADDMPYVWLSMAPIPKETILGHFPNIYAHCLEEGYDVTRECIPVVPAQHYFMGGIKVDKNSHTSMNRLYAVGETACNGVHGANRLASNSLLESLVFAKRAAQKICKQDGIVAGLPVFKRVFELLDPEVSVEFFCKDGDSVTSGERMGRVTGDIRVLLSGERTALNYLQRMSGIATYTNSIVSLLKDSKIKLLDTRKTTPNMRIFEKYAVKVGGGNNHRYNLSDGILLKDNHIGAAGSITNAVSMAKNYASFVRKIEVEVENLEMVKEAVDAGADIIMLDNMSHDDMKKAVVYIDGRAETECSGNVTKENISKLIDIGVDYISSGALTHSAPILDISLKNLHPVT